MSRDKEANYMKISQKVDTIKSEADKSIKQMMYFASAMAQKSQIMEMDMQILKFICGYLLDTITTDKLKEIEIEEETFDKNYRFLVRTVKGEYHYNVSSGKIDLIEPILNNWEMFGRTENAYKWKNTETEQEIIVDYFYDNSATPEENNARMVALVKKKLRHPIELIS